MTTRRTRLPAPTDGLVVLAILLILGCPGLPRDFEDQTLEEKVAAYEEYLDSRGGKHEIARGHIAWHGWAAADLMAQYVTGEKVGLPKYEAIVIIRYVQRRGCSLQGSAAEEALEIFLETGEGNSLERRAAEGALRAIQKNVDFSDFVDDYPPGGPCRGGKEQTQVAP